MVFAKLYDLVLVLDQAGRHGASYLNVPANITLEPLPPRSPEIHPVEHLWLFLKQRYLSHRLLEDYDATVAAACVAWQRLTCRPRPHHLAVLLPLGRGLRHFIDWAA